MKETVKSIISEINHIDWASNFSKELKNNTQFEVQIVQSIDAFKENINSLNWENTTLEASNDLREYLTKNNVQNREYWNKLVDEIKHEMTFIEKINEEFYKKHYIDIKTDLEWNILLIVLEKYYYQYDKKIPLFFHSLLDIYRNGNIPCGFKFNEDWNFSKGGTILYY